jgi:hypothetical protein
MRNKYDRRLLRVLPYRCVFLLRLPSICPASTCCVSVEVPDITRRIPDLPSFLTGGKERVNCQIVSYWLL